MEPLFAQEIGRETYHGLTGELQKSEDFFCKVIGQCPLPAMQTNFVQTSSGCTPKTQRINF